jgi:probable HAF family extracellular repeat protein
MTSPERTPIRRWRILALAAALLLAALVEAGPATARAAEPPPVSCIADNPVDPLGPGFLLDRGRFTTIEHPDDTLETQPLGINNRGQIVGGYDTAGFVFRGFLLDRGRYTTIEVPDASRSFALRINARGQILGDYEDGRGGCHGYLLEKGRVTGIDFPGKPTQALGLNDRGQVVGGIVDVDAGRRIRGFLLDKGVYTPIDFPGALATNALDINARGQIVGIYSNAVGTSNGYLRDHNGDYTPIDPPGATLTFPFGINNRGHVVGFYLDANQVRHGFLFKDGSFTTIDHPLPAADTLAHDLNDRGQIVGLYERVAGQAVEGEGASRSGRGPTRAEDIGSAPSPLTSLGTVSGAASFQ